MSQSEFAKRAGVSLSSQKRYEKGERDPDYSYIEALDKLGVDTHYLLHAVPAAEYGSDHVMAMQWLLRDIADALALRNDVFVEAADELSRAVPKMIETDQADPFNALSTRLVEEALKQSPYFDGVLDEVNLNNFCGVLERIEECQQRLRLSVVPQKKAQLLRMLCEVAGTHELTDKAVEEALKLSASQAG